MDVELNYDDHPELYDDAMRIVGGEEVLEEFNSGNYEDLYQLLEEGILEEGDLRQMAEIVEAQKILNSETGSLAGIDDYLHTGAASD